MSEERKTVEGLMELAPNFGYKTPEPSLINLIHHYYASYLASIDTLEFSRRYLEAVEAYARALVEQERQSSVNAELLEALRKLEAMAERYRPPGYPVPDAQKVARTAITRAEAAQKGKT